MRILVVDDDYSIIEFVTLILGNYFQDCVIDKANKPILAKKHMSTTQYDLVISDYDMSPHGTGADVYDYFEKNDQECTFVLYTSYACDHEEIRAISKKSQDNIIHVKKPLAPKEWKSFLSTLEIKGSKRIDIDYFPVANHNFLRFNTSLCPVYIKINDGKFVKIINENEKYSLELIDKYIKKNVHEFYIEKNDFDNFLVKLSETSFLTLKEAVDTSTFIDIAKKTHRYISSIVSSVGVSEYVLNVSNDIALNTLDRVSKDKSLEKMIAKIVSSNDYIYDHTFLIISLCTYIGKELNISRNVLERLALASILHDINIADAKLCLLHDLAPEKINDLNDEDKKLIETHHLALKDIKDIPEITEDIQNILTYHHIFDEDYPYNRPLQLENINLVIGIFLVAHSFSNELYRQKFDIVKLRDTFTYMRFKFSSNNFKKILSSIEKLFI